VSLKRYAIGDIHGGSQTFRALLNKIGLQREDRVYLLGDYVDRGPDSRGVLDTIICLQEIGFDLRPIRGNHDDMLLRNLTGKHNDYSRHYLEFWGYETMVSFGVLSPDDIPPKYRRFLAGLPYLLEDDRYIFVHASLDMEVADPLKQTDPEVMLWGNGRLISDNSLPGRIIVSGHMQHSRQQIEAALTRPHIQIDNGAFTAESPDYGSLVALNLETMELTLQPWIDD
jgi:serine/threonine protein phosphatase 1